MMNKQEQTKQQIEKEIKELGGLSCIANYLDLHKFDLGDCNANELRELIKFVGKAERLFGKLEGIKIGEETGKKYMEDHLEAMWQRGKKEGEQKAQQLWDKIEEEGLLRDLGWEDSIEEIKKEFNLK